MEVRRISIKDTYPIRHLVLRPNRPIEDCYFDGDKDENTFHLGAFTEGKLASIASFYLSNHQDFEEKHPNQYRLRGMATLEKYRGMGHSSALLKTAFPIIKQNFCDFLWCNARLSAKGFYEKVGFQSYGEVFEIKDIGPHIVMFIQIK